MRPGLYHPSWRRLVLLGSAQVVSALRRLRGLRRRRSRRSLVLTASTVEALIRSGLLRGLLRSRWSLIPSALVEAAAIAVGLRRRLRLLLRRRSGSALVLTTAAVEALIWSGLLRRLLRSRRSLIPSALVEAAAIAVGLRRHLRLLSRRTLVLTAATVEAVVRT
jgi:hypothetical protein